MQTINSENTLIKSKNKIAKKYLNWSIGFFQTEKSFKPFPVNFQKNWLFLLLNQKKLLVFSTLVLLIQTIVITTTPFLLAWLIQEKTINALITIVCIFCLLPICGVLFEFGYTKFQSNILVSLTICINQFFLTVDPIYHTTKSSGQIIAKSTRAAGSVENFIDTLVYEMIYVVVGIVVVFISMFSYDPILGLYGVGSCLILAGASTFSNIVLVKYANDLRINKEDAVKTITIENLQQNLLIRSSFATASQLNKVSQKSKQLATIQVGAWMAATLAYQISRIAFLITFAILAWYIINLLNSNKLDPISATALLVNYGQFSSVLFGFGKKLEKVVQKYLEVSDLFKFINSFGRQTYPVLKDNLVA